MMTITINRTAENPQFLPLRSGQQNKNFKGKLTQYRYSWEYIL